MPVTREKMQNNSDKWLLAWYLFWFQIPRSLFLSKYDVIRTWNMSSWMKSWHRKLLLAIIPCTNHLDPVFQVSSKLQNPQSKWYIYFTILIFLKSILFRDEIIILATISKSIKLTPRTIPKYPPTSATIHEKKDMTL